MMATSVNLLPQNLCCACKLLYPELASAFATELPCTVFYKWKRQIGLYNPGLVSLLVWEGTWLDPLSIFSGRVHIWSIFGQVAELMSQMASIPSQSSPDPYTDWKIHHLCLLTCGCKVNRQLLGLDLLRLLHCGIVKPSSLVLVLICCILLILLSLMFHFVDLYSITVSVWYIFEVVLYLLSFTLLIVLFILFLVQKLFNILEVC